MSHSCIFPLVGISLLLPPLLSLPPPPPPPYPCLSLERSCLLLTFTRVLVVPASPALPADPLHTMDSWQKTRRGKRWVTIATIYYERPCVGHHSNYISASLFRWVLVISLSPPPTSPPTSLNSFSRCLLPLSPSWLSKRRGRWPLSCWTPLHYNL